MLIRDYFDAFLKYKDKKGWHPTTREGYVRVLDKIIGPSVGFSTVEDLRASDFAQVMERGRHFGITGQQRGVLVLKQLLAYLSDSGVRVQFDWFRVPLPKVPRKTVEWLDEEELTKIREMFDLCRLNGLRDRALIEVLHVTGMRIREVLNMNRDDIDWERMEARVRNCKPPHEIDTVYFTPDVLSWIRRYLKSRNDTWEPLFVTYLGERISPSSVRRNIHNYAAKAGITKRIHPHLFRSTLATELLRGGVDIKSVQNIMRHKSERTTLRHYVAVSKKRCKELHQQVMAKGLQAVRS